MKLRIESCDDTLMWYSDLVGQTVDLVREDHDYYWSREPAGPLNIVRKEDARAIRTPEKDEH